MDVVVVGAGPVGLLLAAELRLAGARPVVLDERPQRGEIPKANGLSGLIVRVLELRGLLERFAARSAFAGPVPAFPFGPVPLRFAALAESPLHVLAIPQPRMEELLEERAVELGVDIRRGHRVLDLDQHADGVDLQVRGPDGELRLRAAHVVGCDGAHSVVRQRAGIGFPGTTDDEVLRLGHFRAVDAGGIFTDPDVEVPGGGRLRPGWNHTPRGRVLVTSLQPGVHIVGVREAGEPPTGPLTLPDLQAAVRRVLGADLPLGEPIWLSWTVAQARLADRHRAGRVLLAGDAAHLFAAGGAALNIGLTDAVNLGWKLAAQLRGDAPEGLLDSYQTERRMAAERAMLHTKVQALLDRTSTDTALVDLLTELLGYPEPARHLGELMAGADVRYAMPGADPHPLLGRLVPALALTSARSRVAELHRAARPVLLDLTDDPQVREEASGWSGRIEVVTACCPDPPAPALLVRPDGYVAWAGGGSPRPALEAWFGAP